MLETEEVDDDYFTPVASASLANIFGKTVTDERSENESLKYTPPKAQNSSSPQSVDSKVSSCLFACALVGYEWHNNVYSQKGKLGFAIIKVTRTGSHNIILYDSNKTTLSNTSVTSKLKITLRSNNYISYYDDQNKYWSLYGAQNEIDKIIDLLKMLKVSITTTTESNLSDINPPDPGTSKEIMSLQEEKTAGSDTDSSLNRKTKESILSRMANMGHSVLPPSEITMNKASDSSDTNDTDHHIKAVRHKPVKGIAKRNSTDKALSEHQKIIELHTNSRTGQATEISNAKSFTISDQIVPIASTTFITNPSGNDMNLFITEQRISNSELRINMGRITDKVDQLISQINHLELKDKNEDIANVNTDILHKLLREYENKIKNYETILQQIGTDTSTQSITASTNLPTNTKDEEFMQSKIQTLENMIKDKHKVVLSLQNEVKTLEDAKALQNDVLQKHISKLEDDLRRYKTDLQELTQANEKLVKTGTGTDTSNNIEMENKIKSIMNEIYQAVATNFENGDTYTGETIKKTIGMVIKRVTLGALNEP